MFDISSGFYKVNNQQRMSGLLFNCKIEDQTRKEAATVLYVFMINICGPELVTLKDRSNQLTKAFTHFTHVNMNAVCTTDLCELDL